MRIRLETKFFIQNAYIDCPRSNNMEVRENIRRIRNAYIIPSLDLSK